MTTMFQLNQKFRNDKMEKTISLLLERREGDSFSIS